MTEHTEDAGDLLPCPFCGGEASMRYDGGAFLECSNDQCDATGPKRLGPVGRADDNRDAIAAWNRRAPTPEAADLIHEREAHAETQAALRAFIADLDKSNAALILAREALTQAYVDLRAMGFQRGELALPLLAGALDAIDKLEPPK